MTPLRKRRDEAAFSTRIPLGPQGRLLRGKLFARLGIMTLAYTVAYLVFLAFAQVFIVPDLSNLVASATSDWYVYSAEEYAAFQADAESSGRMWDIWPLDNGSFAIRDLTVYYTVRILKIPVAIALYCIGLTIVILLVLNQSVRYFNELSFAVTQLFKDKNAAISLSPDLYIVDAELARIRERSLADDRAAHAAEERKNELVAYLAHDIKTPLTSVLGYLQLLEESPDLPAKQRTRYAGIALGRAQRLDALIDEFFEITRYNLKGIPLERQRVDLHILCTQAADELYPQATDRKLRIEVSTTGRRDAFVDPGKLARVLANVLRNAVAYADEETTVFVRVSDGLEAEPAALAKLGATHSDVKFIGAAGNGREGTRTGKHPAGGQQVGEFQMGEHQPGEHLAVITVENQGREISASHLETIFERFFREDGARTSSEGGAGLGLAIAKEIVGAHGGVISAASEAGKTTFTIVLPR